MSEEEVVEDSCSVVDQAIQFLLVLSHQVTVNAVVSVSDIYLKSNFLETIVVFE